MDEMYYGALPFRRSDSLGINKMIMQNKTAHVMSVVARGSFEDLCGNSMWPKLYTTKLGDNPRTVRGKIFINFFI